MYRKNAKFLQLSKLKIDIKKIITEAKYFLSEYFLLFFYFFLLSSILVSFPCFFSVLYADNRWLISIVF